ncbi:MAG: prepilin-type N-terminal cleavage/methylation domain-containing protein [Patescibacteria group bacterium]|nr:prepilin-type N-terminal cleavage/methylation domain-containing protein [Patescibacteria group bacterium]
MFFPSFKQNNGFTLIEMLISVAILSIITGIGVINLTNYKNRHSFELDTKNVLEATRNAENKSILGDQGTGWGIKFTSNVDNGYFEIFSGTSYATSSVVVTQYLSSASRFSNPPPGFSKTIVFGQITGVPDASQMIALKTVTGSDSSITSLGARGTLNQLPGKDLVGYWPMDEGLGTTAYDASGKGNNGTINGSMVWQTSASCKTGACLNFGDFVGQNITGSNNGSSLDANTGLTLSAWIYPTGPASADGFETILLGSGAYYLSFNYTSNALSCYWYGTNPEGYHTTPMNSVPYNTWTHVSCVWDGAHINQYINGVVSNTVAVAGLGNAPSAFNIGDESARQFHGKIDDLRVYNRALTATEVKTLYESY